MAEALAEALAPVVMAEVSSLAATVEASAPAAMAEALDLVAMAEALGPVATAEALFLEAMAEADHPEGMAPSSVGATSDLWLNTTRATAGATPPMWSAARQREPTNMEALLLDVGTTGPNTTTGLPIQPTRKVVMVAMEEAMEELVVGLVE
jgi:hypothetical protein